MTARKTRSNGEGRLSDLDKLLGAEVRRIRLHAGMSQQALGAAIDLTFQQVQKYERGTNVMSPSRFVAICRALEVDAPSLMAKVMSDMAEPRFAAGVSERDRGVLELVRSYRLIHNKKTRELCRLIVAVLATIPQEKEA